MGMDMEYRFTATHKFRFTLEEGVAYFEGGGDTHEITTVEIVFDWYEEDDGEPAGWNLDTGLFGWPLTAKGARDKRIKVRERVNYYRYPVALRELVLDAYVAAVKIAGIDPDLILNPATGLLDPERYLAE